MTNEQLAFFREWVDLETRGEATCRARAGQSEDAGQRAKWLLLAELERGTKQAVADFLAANGIAVEERAEKHREGEVRARETASLPWLDIMGMMRPRLVPYVEELRAFASHAPPPQQAIASRLLEHEEALLDLVERELRGEGERSTEPVRAHLDKWAGRRPSGP
jgi:hypothetical protein